MRPKPHSTGTTSPKLVKQPRNILIVPKPRYDADEDISRHAAIDEGCCEEMERQYGWQLMRIEATPEDPIFKVDCVFDGKTEFPKSYYDTDKE